MSLKTSSNKPCLSILLPNYRTPELTKLCLRMIRMHLDLQTVRVIVIDNDSQDASLEYLRSVPWIRLIERKAVPGQAPADAHSAALDLGLSETETEFVMSIHTDTFFLDAAAPDMLLEPFNDPQVAGTGSWKLEYVPPLKRAGKWLEQWVRNYVAAPFCGRKFGELTGRYKEHWYLRSHCAVYRTELLKKLNLSFNGGATAGKMIHQTLTQSGYRMVFFPPETLMPHLLHLDHATMILNPETGGRKTARPAARRNLRKALESMDYRKILNAPMSDC